MKDLVLHLYLFVFAGFLNGTVHFLVFSRTSPSPVTSLTKFTITHYKKKGIHQRSYTDRNKTVDIEFQQRQKIMSHRYRSTEGQEQSQY